MSWSSQFPTPISTLPAQPSATVSYTNWQQHQQSPHTDTHPQSPPPNTSKRSRISRACDTCKKKKSKCDVDNSFPCTTCQQYDWDCTFNETTRKRGPPKGYIGNLEERLERMENLLNKLQGQDPDNNTPTNVSTSQSIPSLQQQQNCTATDSTHSPSSTENNTYNVSTGRSTGNSSTSSKGKVVRYLGSSSGLYLVNDILSNQSQTNNAVDRSPTIPSLSSSSASSASKSATMYTNYGNDPADSVSNHGTTLHDKRPSSDQFSRQSSTPETLTIENISKPTHNNTNNNKVTYLKTKQGNYCRLRRVNGVDDDLVMVRDETEDDTKDQVEAANEQEHMDSVVPRSMLSALVKIYFDADCATLPILDQDEFMESFEGKMTPPPAPLLTYAICSCACFLVPSDHPLFTQSGLKRDDIFHALIDRAGVFIRSQYLIPRIQTIQALVLLCAHPTVVSKSDCNWVLAGMAVRMAQDLGLHRLVTPETCDLETIEKRKRLWYSVYLTDRWCCCVLGRPLAITDSDCDVDLPSVDAVGHPGKYAMFVNLVKLSGILGEVLRRIYSSKAKSMGYGTHIMEQTVWSLDKMLKEWFDQVPPEYLITPKQLHEMKGMERTFESRFRLGGPLTVCYYAVVILLFRPFLIFECYKHHSSKLFDDAPKRCMDAAKNSIDVARHVPKEQISRFGWNFAAYSMYQATLIHVYNCTNSDSFIAQTSRKYTDIAIGECVAPLSKDVPFGPPVLQFLKILLNLTKVDSCFGQPSSPTKSFESPTTTTLSPDKSKISHHPPELSTSIQNFPSNMPHTSEPTPTPIPSESSLIARHHLVNNSIPNSNLVSSPVPSDTFTSNPMDFLNSFPTQESLLQHQITPMTQASWQMLFSFAGAPFTNTTNNGYEFDSFRGDMYIDDQVRSNFGL